MHATPQRNGSFDVTVRSQNLWLVFPGKTLWLLESRFKAFHSNGLTQAHKLIIKSLESWLNISFSVLRSSIPLESCFGRTLWIQKVACGILQLFQFHSSLLVEYFFRRGKGSFYCKFIELQSRGHKSSIQGGTEPSHTVVARSDCL